MWNHQFYQEGSSHQELSVFVHLHFSTKFLHFFLTDSRTQVDGCIRFPEMLVVDSVLEKLPRRDGPRRV